MSNYTIKSGDTLWGICKKQYNLKTNTEIANKVKELAKNNNISNPNLIFAGKTLDLGSAMDTVEITTPTDQTSQPEAVSPETPQAASNPVDTGKKEYSAEIEKAYEDRAKTFNIKSYDDFMAALKSKVSIFSSNTKTDEQKEQAYNDYAEKLLTSHYDKDGDGKVTVEEFSQVEEEGANQSNEICMQHDESAWGMNYTQEDKDLSKVISNRLTGLFAKNLDLNGDGTISKEELSFFEKTADSIDGKTDGEITAGAESKMVEAVTGSNAEDKKINEVVNKYLQGGSLTDEEQKILDESSVKIRAAMRKAAGLDK